MLRPPLALPTQLIASRARNASGSASAAASSSMLSTSSSAGSTSCSASPCFASHGASFGPSFAIAIFLPIAPALMAAPLAKRLRNASGSSASCACVHSQEDGIKHKGVTISNVAQGVVDIKTTTARGPL